MRNIYIILIIISIFILFGSLSLQFNIEKFEDKIKDEDLKSQMADIQSKLIDQKDLSSSWQDKYDKLNLQYQNLDEKLNETKRLLQKEQNISNQNSYLEVPNFECKDCDLIKSFETSFEKCQEMCNDDNSCDLINYYSPNNICKLIKNMDYDKMKYSSYDMYLKTNKNNIKQFNINKLLQSQSST